MAWTIRGIFLVLHQFLDALLADVLSPVGNQTPGRSAEQAGWLEFLQNDPVIFHKNLQFVPFRNIQRAAQFDWQNDSAQIINLANYSRRLHPICFPSLYCFVAYTTTYLFYHYTVSIPVCQILFT